MSEASCKIAKTARCLIARHVLQYADIEYAVDGTIYSYDVDSTKDVIDMQVVEEYYKEPGTDLIKDTEEAIKVALKAIERHGKDYIELLFDNPSGEIYVHYHSMYESVPLYIFDDYSILDKFIVDYIKEKFEEAEISIAEC